MPVHHLKVFGAISNHRSGRSRKQPSRIIRGGVLHAAATPVCSKTLDAAPNVLHHQGRGKGSAVCLSQVYGCVGQSGGEGRSTRKEVLAILRCGGSGEFALIDGKESRVEAD